MPSVWLGWDVVQRVLEHPCSSAGSWSSPAPFCTAGGVHHLFQQLLKTVLLKNWRKKKDIKEPNKKYSSVSLMWAFAKNEFLPDLFVSRLRLKSPFAVW